MAERVHLCPMWIGYLLASPVRRLFQRPDAILGHNVQPGMTVMDLGCAMGYFSIPMAQRVGEAGRVICLDVQEPMLEALRRRAARAGVASRIEPRLTTAAELGIDDLSGAVDFCLAVYVLHEIQDQAGALEAVTGALAPAGKLLIFEPRGHVSAADFEATLEHARQAGLVVVDRPRFTWSRAAVLSRALAGPAG